MPALQLPKVHLKRPHTMLMNSWRLLMFESPVKFTFPTQYCSFTSSQIQWIRENSRSTPDLSCRNPTTWNKHGTIVELPDVQNHCLLQFCTLDIRRQDDNFIQRLVKCCLFCWKLTLCFPSPMIWGSSEFLFLSCCWAGPPTNRSTICVLPAHMVLPLVSYAAECTPINNKQLACIQNDTSF